MTGMTRQAAGLAVLLIVGWFCTSTAAAQAPPSINVGSKSGSQGQKVSFDVTLALNGSGAAVAGTQNDISFDASTAIGVQGSHCVVTTGTPCSCPNGTACAECPLYAPPFQQEREACIAGSNLPDCTVNPATGKQAFFTFQPSGCTGASCAGIRALVLAIGNVTAIPDQSVLYSCNVDIAPDATAGDHPLTISNSGMGGPGGNPITPVGQNGGAITVTGAGGDSDGDGVPDASDNCPYAPNPDQADRGGIGSGSAADGIGDACQCGDVNGSGQISVTDSVIILRSLLVPPTASQPKPELCDVGGSAGCSLADATIILRGNLSPPTASISQNCAPAKP